MKVSKGSADINLVCFNISSECVISIILDGQKEEHKSEKPGAQEALSKVLDQIWGHQLWNPALPTAHVVWLPYRTKELPLERATAAQKQGRGKRSLNSLLLLKPYKNTMQVCRPLPPSEVF